MYSNIVNRNDEYIASFQNFSPVYTPCYHSNAPLIELNSIDNNTFEDLDKIDRLDLQLSPSISMKSFNKIERDKTISHKSNEYNVTYSTILMNPYCIDIAFDFQIEEEKNIANSIDENENFVNNLSALKKEPLAFIDNSGIVEDKISYTRMNNLIDTNRFIEILKMMKDIKQYICQYCDEKFVSGCALGGHISKTHRKSTQKYKKGIFKKRPKTIEKERSIFFRKTIKS